MCNKCIVSICIEASVTCVLLCVWQAVCCLVLERLRSQLTKNWWSTRTRSRGVLDWVSLHTALLLSVRMLLMCPVGILSASEVCGQMINGSEHTVPHLMTHSVYDNVFSFALNHHVMQWSALEWPTSCCKDLNIGVLSSARDWTILISAFWLIQLPFPRGFGLAVNMWNKICQVFIAFWTAKSRRQNHCVSNILTTCQMKDSNKGSPFVSFGELVRIFRPRLTITH